METPCSYCFYFITITRRDINDHQLNEMNYRFLFNTRKMHKVAPRNVPKVGGTLRTGKTFKLQTMFLYHIQINGFTYELHTAHLWHSIDVKYIFVSHGIACLSCLPCLREGSHSIHLRENLSTTRKRNMFHNVKIPSGFVLLKELSSLIPHSPIKGIKNTFGCSFLYIEIDTSQISNTHFPFFRANCHHNPFFLFISKELHAHKSNYRTVIITSLWRTQEKLTRRKRSSSHDHVIGNNSFHKCLALIPSKNTKIHHVLAIKVP